MGLAPMAEELPRNLNFLYLLSITVFVIPIWYHRISDINLVSQVRDTNLVHRIRDTNLVSHVS